MPNEIDKIEIRSDEVQEILGFIPHWIIRGGISVIFFIIILLFIGSWYFKYPDVISSNIIITTQNPPVRLIAKTSGKIETVLVKDKQIVNENELIAIIENSADYNNIHDLNIKLDSLNTFILSFDISEIINFNPYYKLGSIQSIYSSFLTQYQNYFNFVNINYHQRKIEALNLQLEQIKQQHNSYFRQMNIQEQEFSLAKLQFERDSGLYVKNVIPSQEFEKAKGDFLQKKYALEISKNSIINNRISETQLQQSILDLELQFTDQKNKLQLELKSTFDVLKSSIEDWKMKYLFESPVSGKVSFNKIVSENQNIAIGEVAFIIVPEKQGTIIGHLQLAVAGAGKVKENQKVNIKLDNYPFMEYGTIQGRVKSVSLVPSENFYLVKIQVPQNLITNYNKTLPFAQQMNGTADIITENISVLERMFNPLKLIFKKYKD
ncbi:MAG: HlyD family efflux transporter periplasmic adaptor subunit [Bacteroidales bacterium]|nr:HlyD family efflux transporter periplasmic adaptor subunit [Bacteroidales bacterium]MBN2757027.1 HlyD family efflux transporter periplasmic adaptor subunit [Bacteroidales bacterium]